MGTYVQENCTRNLKFILYFWQKICQKQSKRTFDLVADNLVTVTVYSTANQRFVQDSITTAFEYFDEALKSPCGNFMDGTDFYDTCNTIKINSESLSLQDGLAINTG